MFPTSTLSVGWTTRYTGAIFNSSYSEEHVGTKHSTYVLQFSLSATRWRTNFIPTCIQKVKLDE
jgi:hypothetical protein